MLIAAILGTTLAHAQLGDMLSSRRPYLINYNRATEALDCAPVDLRPQMRARGLPAERRQGESGWCYAFVVADLASYQAGENLSPADIARAYIQAHPEAFQAGGLGMGWSYPLGGGFMNLAWEAAQTRGICREADFPSEDYNPPELPLPQPGQPKPPEPWVELSPEALFAHFAHPDLPQLLTQIQSMSFRRVLRELEGRTCEARPVAAELNWVVRRRFEDPSLHAPLDAALDDHRPVGLAIDAAFLNRAPTQGMVATPSAGHAVVVAGRRFNVDAGRCEYLVRNTQGNCRQYADGFECVDNHAWVPRQVVRLGSLALIDLRP